MTACSSQADCSGSWGQRQPGHPALLGAGQGSSTGTTTYTDLQPGTGLAPLYTLSNRQGNSHSGFGRLMANLQKEAG